VSTRRVGTPVQLAHEQAEPRSRQQQPHHRQHQCRKADDRDAAPRKDDSTDRFDPTRHPGRILDLDVLRTEDRSHRLHQDQADAPGRKQGLQRAPVEKPNDAALERHPDQACRDKRRRHRRDQIGVEQGGKVGAEKVLNDVCGVRADHNQLTVSHVDDAHQTIGDRQPKRGEQQNAAERDAAEYAPDHFSRGKPALDCVQRFFGLGANVCVRFGEGVAVLLEHAQ
jgi:hypothetical protein